LVGDSVPFYLREEFDSSAAPDLGVDGASQLGCGLVTTPRLVDGQPEDVPPACATWTTRWRSEAPGLDYDVAALFLGIGEQFDHEVDGTRLRFASDAFARYLAREVDADVQALASQGRPVALVTVPCHDIPDSGLSETASVVNDERRVAWLNTWIRDYVQAHPGVHLVDLHDHLCPGGVYQEEVDGVRLRDDGLHFNADGASVVWRWLGPQLTQVAGLPATAGRD